METRKIFCKTKEHELGTLTLPDKTPDEIWNMKMADYYCTDHDEIPKPPEPLDITIAKISEDIEEIKKNINDLKGVRIESLEIKK